jgi:uncharacterized protein (TIGR02145 family)
MKFFKQKRILILFILLIIVSGLLFLALIDKNSGDLDKTSGDCNRNKKFSITIGEDKVYCDHKGRMWSYTLPGIYRWSEAVDICSDLVYAKTDDWELPDIISFNDLYDSNYRYVACKKIEGSDNTNNWSLNNWDINVCAPSNPPVSSDHYHYWSSSKSDNDNNTVWRIFGYYGDLDKSKKDDYNLVRCVKKQ